MTEADSAPDCPLDDVLREDVLDDVEVEEDEDELEDVELELDDDDEDELEDRLDFRLRERPLFDLLSFLSFLSFLLTSQSIVPLHLNSTDDGI